MANKNFRCFPVGKLPIQALRRLLEQNRIADVLTCDGLCDLPLYEQDELTKL